MQRQKERERDGKRQTDIHTDTQMERQTERERDGERQTYIQIHRWRDRQGDRKHRQKTQIDGQTKMDLYSN